MRKVLYSFLNNIEKITPTGSVLVRLVYHYITIILSGVCDVVSVHDNE